jgi:hypothetical protein
MLRLPGSLKAWGRPDFDSVLKQEIEQLDPGLLPLQQGLARSSYALGEGFGVAIKRVCDEAGRIRVRIGVFFSGVIAGCSCADDPTALEAQPEYCEMELVIDKRTAETTVSLLE